MIHHIEASQLKGITSGDGLILRGCGGDPAEWLKGINEMLTNEGILKNGGEFKDIYVFEHGGTTNILYPFDKLDSEVLDMGKLAIWRLQTHSNFAGTWHSDYLDNNPDVGMFASDVAYDSAEITQPNAVGLKLYIENVHDTNVGGFTIPLPTNQETLQPFLEGIEIASLRDVNICSIETDIEGLGDKLLDILSSGGKSPSTLSELNYLATKVAEIVAHGEDGGMNIVAANIEADKNCGSIAEIINLVSGENLNEFDVFPTFDAEDYGDILVNQFMADEYAHVFHRLKDSADPDERAFIAHFEKLEKHVDKKAFGLEKAQEEGGVFTEQGYLIAHKNELPLHYKGLQDIPIEYRLTISALTAREAEINNARKEERGALGNGDKPSVLTEIAEHREATRNNPPAARDKSDPVLDKKKSDPDL